MPRCRLPKGDVRLIEIIQPNLFSFALKIRHISIGADQFQIAADYTVVENAQHVLVRPISKRNAFSLALFSVFFP